MLVFLSLKRRSHGQIINAKRLDLRGKWRLHGRETKSLDLFTSYPMCFSIETLFGTKSTVAASIYAEQGKNAQP